MHRTKFFMKKAILIPLLLLALLIPVFAGASPLTEHILTAINNGETPSKRALLLLTLDLKWYEGIITANKLSPKYQAMVQQLRITVAGNTTQMAAIKMNEAASIFAATGSWNPGRDMDIIYFGKNGDSAAGAISSSYETVTGRILEGAENDPLLRNFSGTVPRSLTAESLSVCTTELPNYGYTDLHKSYQKAKEALARGESPENIIKRMRAEIREAMGANMKAHFAAAANQDYYAGATGQEWFRKTYLEDKEKMRVFAQNAEGEWALNPGGLAAVPKDIVERTGFGSFEKAGNVKFAKMASDYALFYAHMHGGLSDNAKYALRVWKDVGLNAIQDLTDDELKILAVAKVINNNPGRANQILAEFGFDNVDDFNAGVSRIMHRWTESQMFSNMEHIVAELSSSSGKTVDELEKMIRVEKNLAKSSMDLNEIVAGLNKLGGVPDGKLLQTQLLEALQARFGNTDSGKAAIKFILKNLGQLGDTGGLTVRIVRMLATAGRISEAEAEAAIAGGRLSGSLESQVNRVKKELIALTAGGMVEFDNALDLEALMNDWRQAQPGGLLQAADEDIGNIIREMQDATDVRLRDMGWTAEEIAIQNRIRAQLRPNKQMMPTLGSRLKGKLAKAGINLRDVQADVRKLMFNPEYTKFGDASMSVGAFDGIMGAGAAMFQTYTILNGPPMSEADETIALSNAWVENIPVVGDISRGLNIGSEGYWEGDKGKMAEAGLWMVVGVTGMVPGGQLPAVVGSMMLALKPVAEGVYEASQAQNLVQSWVESGQWSSDKPPVLKGIYDEGGLIHRLTYDEILGTKGEVKYYSNRITSLHYGASNIGQSVREYADKYVLAGNKNVDVLRENLKTLFPDLGDNVLNDLSYSEIKLNEKKSKLGMMFFKLYERQVRGAYIQTIAHLKKWAEDERRVAKDYDGEVKRLRAELAALEKELKNATLVRHADDIVVSYTKIATNLFEQESLPLSRVRIYENYISTYKKIRDQLKAVAKHFAEASSQFVPNSWYLTGYPVFDKDITNRLVGFMASERANAVKQVEDLLKDLNQKDIHLNLQDACHKQAFAIIASKRYKIAFMQHLVEYYNGLAGESSKWSDAYESARSSYETTRDNLLKVGVPKDVVYKAAYTDAFETFFFAMGFAIASNEADGYRQLANSYEAQLIAAREHDKSDRAAGTESEAGKALQQCLKVGLTIQIELSNTQPEAGTEVEASVKLTKGSLPKETTWKWEISGGLSVKPRYGDKTTVKAETEGVLTLRLMDERYDNKSIAETSVRIVPKEKPKKDTANKKLLAAKELAAKGLYDEAITMAEEALRLDPKNVEIPQLIKKWIAEKGKIKKVDCQYEYSEWGKCSSETNKQNRSVVAKNPAGCVEKSKPVLEQSCIPTPKPVPITIPVPTTPVSPPTTTENTDTQAPKSTQDTGTTGMLCGRYKFSASAPEIWSGGNTDKGFSISRKTAQATNSQNGSISASFSVDGHGYKSDRYKKREDILSSLEKEVKEGSGGCGGSESFIKQEVTDFAIDDFKGGLLDFGVWFVHHYVDGRGNTRWVCANGHGFVIDKYGCLIDIKFNIGGGDGPDATDRSYLIQQAQAAHSEMLAILKSLRIDPNGTITATPYKGRKLDGSDMMKVKLVPATLGKVKVGDSISIQVVVENARPEDSPLKYTWTGDYVGSGATVKLKTTKPGKYTVSVSVDSAQGLAGSASIEYTVAEPITVKLEKIKPAGNSVVIGQAGSFKATVMAGGSPASGDFVIRWEPYKDRVAQFKAREIQGASGTNEIKFMSPGNYFVYVDVLEKVEGKLQTAGESEQISIQAINPTWEMGFEPAQPKVGQLVNAKVQATGVTDEDMKPMSFEWRLPDNAKQTGADQKDGVATFYLKDTKPANIKCIARLDGENLGGAGKTITAQGYQVSISEPKYSGPPIQMWQCETQLGGAPKCGMVQLKSTQFVTHSDIHFAVTTTPAPEGPRYKWAIDPAGSCGSPGAGSEIKINCSNTGTYTVHVEVTNAEGVKLGEASRAISITISQEQINKSNKSKDAYDKLQKAKELVSQGKLDEGIQMADEASQLDSKNTEATKLSNTWKRDKQGIQSYLKNMDSKLTQHKVEEAEKELAQAQKLHPKYQPVVDAEKRLQDAKKKAEEEKKKAEELKKRIADKIAKAKELVAQGKLDEGIVQIDEALKLDPKNTEALGLASKWKAEKQTVIKHVADVKQLITGSKIPEAEKALSEAQRLHPKYAPVIEAEKLLKDAKAKKDVIDKIAKAKELVGQGKLDEGIALISEAVKLDPKQKEAAAQGAKWKAEKQIVMKHVGSIKKLLSANKIVAAEKELAIAQKLHSKYAPVVEVEKLLNAAKQKKTDKDKDKQVAKEKQAQALLNEGGVLEQKGDLAGAIKKYQAAVKIVPNKKISDHIVELQKKIKEGSKENQAQALLNEGGALEQKGDLAGAIKKYQAAVKIVPNKKISDHIVELQKKIKEGSKENQAQALLNEGGVLEQKGDLAGAIKKYQAAVKIVPNKKISNHIEELQAKIKKKEEDAMKESALKSEQSLKYKQAKEQALKEIKAEEQRAAQKRREQELQPQQPAPLQKPWETKDAGKDNSGLTKDETEEPAVAILLKPGIYRSASGGSWMFTNVTSTSMSFAWWQTNEAYPPKDHSKYFGRGTAKAIGGGLWRISGKDQPGYCCGNETKNEFRILSPTSVESLRGSYWKIGTARHPEGQWNINERVVLNLVQDSTPVTTNVAPSKEALNIAGSWEQTDGNCKGTRMEIAQNVNNGVTISQEGHCRGGEHSKVKYLCRFGNDNRTLYCSYHFTLRPAGWLDGKNEIIFTDENNAQMPWRAEDGQSGSIKLKRVGHGTGTQKNMSQQPEKQSVQPSGKTGAEKANMKSTVISNNWNTGGVSSKPTKATRFKLTQSSHITLIENYHYGNKRSPGTMKIKSENGKEYGPFTAVGSPAVPPAALLWYWQCKPNVTLPPGTYTVIDSDPGTWSHNSESGGSGFSKIEGYTK